MSSEALARYLELRKRLQELTDGLSVSSFVDGEFLDAVRNAGAMLEYNKILAELVTISEGQELSDEFERAHGRIAGSGQEIDDWVERGKPKP
ncbi:MAG: hypothetical protein HC861_00850 [Rhodospirillaceae bacterium]|nr:hypothetical protein [Rhodospirillaceae bacterium]